jgi:radical SAM protein with 4Fe4S-binding SPASM domain
MANFLKTNSFLPPTAVFEMTYKCNHTCLFCSCPWEYSGSDYKKDTELNLEEWKQCIDLLIEYGTSSFSFTGGEPLLNENLKEIIKYIHSVKACTLTENLETELNTPHMFLISNGQLLDESWLDFIKEYNVNLSMSLPGLKTYNKHTGFGECDKILNLFRKAKDRKIHTTVNITVTKLNLFEVEETIANALISGADTLLLNRFLPGGRGMLHVNELFLNSEETIQMLVSAENVLKKANRFGTVGTEMPLCLLKDLKFTNLNIGTRCSAATGFFVVGPEGFIRTCNHSPVKLVHFSELQKLKTHSYWKSFTLKDYIPDDCSGCGQLSKCDGGCREAAHVFNGNICALDPVFTINT